MIQEYTQIDFFPSTRSRLTAFFYYIRKFKKCINPSQKQTFQYIYENSFTL